MDTCADCKHADIKRGPKGNVGQHTIGKCTYAGPLTPACNRDGAVFAIMRYTGEGCPAWTWRRLTEAEYAARS